MADDSNSIYLKLSGDDISPKNVRISTLFGILGGLERAIEAMAEEMGVEFEENESIIIPGQLQESSLNIPGTINRKARDPLRHIDRAFYADELSDLPSTVRSELRSIQSTLGKRGVRLEMAGEDVGLHGVALTADAPHIEASADDSDEMTSHAVVYGVYMRVNRTTNDARIELHDGSGCTIEDLTECMIQFGGKAFRPSPERVHPCSRMQRVPARARSTRSDESHGRPTTETDHTPSPMSTSASSWKRPARI
jgi:hypothetical protein